MDKNSVEYRLLNVPAELDKKPNENGFEYLNRVICYYRNSGHRTPGYKEMLR